MRHLRLSPQKRFAISIVELLVAISVVGVLLSLLLPAVQSARESGRRTQCGNNLRQVALAVASYESRMGRYPPSHTALPEPRHGLIPYILGQLGEMATYERYDFDVSWNEGSNKQVVGHTLPQLLCPSTPEQRESATDYVPAPTLSSTLYEPLIGRRTITRRARWTSMLQPKPKTIRSGSVRDGLTNSFMLFEVAGRPAMYKGGKRVAGIHGGAHWASDGSSTGVRRYCNETQLANCENIQGIFSFHPQGCNYAYGDAAVRFHSVNMDAEVWVSLFTMSAGDLAAPPDE